MLPDDIIAEIERCWSGVPYPGDDDLTVHPLGLDEVFYEGLIGKSWNALTQSFLDYHADCVGLLAPKGFQYYLPAFLLAVLKRSEATPIEAWLLPALKGCLGGGSSIKRVSGSEWFISRMNVATHGALW